MSCFRARHLFVCLAFSLASPLAAAADDEPGATAAVEITEWAVPFKNSRPRDPAVAPDGTVWFVGQGDGYIAALDPGTGEFTRVDLSDGSAPHNLIVGADGTIWIAGNRKGYIGRYKAGDAEIHEIPMPDPAARDPHTLIMNADESVIWFTMQQSGMAGRLTIADETVAVFKVPGSRPYGITIAPDGTPWIALFGTNQLLAVDPETLALTVHDLPRKGARPRRLEATSDGQLWYVDYAGGYLGRLNPTDGSIKEFELPAGKGSRPYGMAVDANDTIWLVEAGPNPNTFVGFDTAALAFTSVTPIPSGAGTVRHMFYDAATNSVWFGTDANTIGRAVLP